MWMLMYVSYLLMGMSFVLLGLTGLMGYFQFTVWNANHMEFALISSILYMFTETLIMFYFIITGKKIKEYIKENQCDAELYRGVIKMKMNLFWVEQSIVGHSLDGRMALCLMLHYFILCGSLSFSIIVLKKIPNWLSHYTIKFS